MPQSLSPPQNAAKPGATETKYEYKKLQTPTSIRVLHLHNSQNPEGHLSGDLQEVDLKNHPRFTSLSYVWGDPSLVSTVSCRSGDVPIAKNCYEALVAIRYLYGEITIWVDAICINQDDNEEKKQQIPLMGEIYTWATTV